jgi:hypothetical protein
MIDKIKAFFEFSAKTGVYMPGAYDALSDKPSVSLLMTHLSSYIAMGSIIYLICKDAVAGTIAAILYATLMIVFYLMRKLTHAKFDLDDKSIDLANDDKG